MKLIPQKRWKKILFLTLIALFITALIILTYVAIAINSDIETQTQILNPTGSKTELIIYHPGITSFMKDVTYAFSNGLVSNNWRVEITTPSTQAPSNIVNYDLLVLGSPVYGFRLTPTIERQLERFGDLNKIDTVALITAAGSPGESAQAMEQAITDANGTFTQAIILYSMAPNQDDQSAVSLAEQAAKNIK